MKIFTADTAVIEMGVHILVIVNSAVLFSRHTECADNLVSGRGKEDHIAHHGSLRAAALLCPGSLDSEQAVWTGRSMVRVSRGGFVIAGSVECVSCGI